MPEVTSTKLVRTWQLQLLDYTPTQVHQQTCTAVYPSHAPSCRITSRELHLQLCKTCTTALGEKRTLYGVLNGPCLNLSCPTYTQFFTIPPLLLPLPLPRPQTNISVFPVAHQELCYTKRFVDQVGVQKARQANSQRIQNEGCKRSQHDSEERTSNHA